MHFLSVCAVSLLLRRLDDKTADIYIYIYIYLSEAVPQGFVPQAPTSQPSFFELPMASVASGGADAPPPPPPSGGSSIPTKGGMPDLLEEEEEEEEEDNEGPHPAAWTDGRPCLVAKGGCGHPSGYLRKGACRFRG
jgi:hypothetical protein